LRDQGLTQKQVAEELGCTDRGIRKTERGTNYDNIIISSPPTKQQGTSQDYLLRRVADEAPELVPEIGKGKKFKSARAAAIAAGIIKPKISFQVSPDESGASIASSYR
jgi:transcriptional regulator with XRE-family HTH domain